jgi:hypothetical protein
MCGFERALNPFGWFLRIEDLYVGDPGEMVSVAVTSGGVGRESFVRFVRTRGMSLHFQRLEGFEEGFTPPGAAFCKCCYVL